MNSGLVTQLLHHESIVTTLAKAKGIVRSTDKVGTVNLLRVELTKRQMITLAKRNSNASRSLAQSFLYVRPERIVQRASPDRISLPISSTPRRSLNLSEPASRVSDHWTTL